MDLEQATCSICYNGSVRRRTRQGQLEKMGEGNSVRIHIDTWKPFII